MIFNYTASADNTIVNVFNSNLQTRATGANAGTADILEVFSIYGRQTTSSQELSRVLIKFPIDNITADRTAGSLPASGSVSFYLRLYAAETSKTVPPGIILLANPMANPWEEGVGLDLENYKDLTKGAAGSNWMNASSTASWNSVSGGGDWLSSSADYRSQQTFETGLEDLELDITPLVENWIAGADAGGIANYGMGVKLTSSQEAKGFSTTVYASSDQPTQNIQDGAIASNYTKRFFARGTQYFFKQPMIQARWDSKRSDHRGQFYMSSSIATSENINDLYYYNYVRGRLRSIPTSHGIIMKIYSSSAEGGPDTEPLQIKNISDSSVYSVTATEAATGVYKARLQVTGTLTTLHDVWSINGGDYQQFHTGTIIPVDSGGSDHPREPTYYANITNLQNNYMPNQTARFNVYIREKNWNPTIYTKAIASAPTTTIETGSYRVIRIQDGLEAVRHDTGSSTPATGLSYDVSGNYFDFNMKLLAGGYEYGFKLAFYDDELNSWQEQNELFKFRVNKYEH